MSRIRFLRILLPLAIVVFLTVLAFQLRPPAKPHSEGMSRGEGGTQGEGLKFRNLDKPDEQVSGTIDRVTTGPEGESLLEGVHQFELNRIGRDPLVVDATKGVIAGAEGERAMRFDQGVTLTDPQAGIVVELPELDVDERAGVASTDRPVALSSPNLEGSADGGLVYSLEDAPTRLRRIDLRDREGGRVRAELALLHDGSSDIELLRSVQLERGGQQLEAERMRATRRDGRFDRAIADGAVRGSTEEVNGEALAFSAGSADILWGAGDSIERAELHTQVLVTHLDRSLRSDSLEVARRPDDRTEISARGAVELHGTFGGERGRLTSTSLDAELDAAFEVQWATASIDVRFDGDATRAEAERARYEQGTIELLGSGSRKARLARERMRVGAERIVSRIALNDLIAERGVEATLLPEGGGNDGIFRGEDAIHFVSVRLEAEGGGDRLVFTDRVRGWQGEHNIAADRVEVSRTDGDLHATGSVESRLPRDPAAGATTDSDFVTVRADSLKFDDGEGLALYEGEVSVIVREGRIDSERFEVRLDDAREVEELTASGEVRLEWTDASSDPPTVTRGRADRLIHRPAEGVIWLIGEKRPAEVERSGGRSGTTEGRQLRYDLESGGIEVEAGSRGPARIQAETDG